MKSTQYALAAIALVLVSACTTTSQKKDHNDWAERSFFYRFGGMERR